MKRPGDKTASNPTHRDRHTGRSLPRFPSSSRADALAGLQRCGQGTLPWRFALSVSDVTEASVLIQGAMKREASMGPHMTHASVLTASCGYERPVLTPPPITD